jgi:magnesium transporter
LPTRCTTSSTCSQAETWTPSTGSSRRSIRTDLAALFVLLSKDHTPRVISRLRIARVSDLMEELPDHLRDDLAEHLQPNELTEAIEVMASDDTADVLADLPESRARALIEALPVEDRREVRDPS